MIDENKVELCGIFKNDLLNVNSFRYYFTLTNSFLICYVRYFADVLSIFNSSRVIICKLLTRITVFCNPTVTTTKQMSQKKRIKLKYSNTKSVCCISRFLPCYWSGPHYWIWFLSNCARFPENICNGCDIQIEDTYTSGHQVLVLVLSHFCTCKCCNVKTNFSRTCLVSLLFSFEHYLSTSFLLESRERNCSRLLILPLEIYH